jgi:hypothetical protein
MLRVVERTLRTGISPLTDQSDHLPASIKEAGFHKTSKARMVSSHIGGTGPPVQEKASWFS